ncbi:MAG: hypothetical protein WBX01_02315 [Nitrososphaeraceae archaeon]
MKTRNIAIVAVAAMLLATSAISTSASTYSAFAYKKNQATSQANACGNGEISTNIGCQGTDSQIQGDENTGALTAQQIFPEVEREKDHQRPVPPPKVGCPDDYVWDLTLDDPLGDLPTGTVLCSFNGLGGSQTVQIEDTEEELVNIVEGDSCVISDRSGEGHASSGTPPDPLEIGDSVCVTEL